jgi:hypothetical protein
MSKAKAKPAPIDAIAKQKLLFSAVDQFLESLAQANIAFNVPPSLNLNDTAQIQLLLSMEQSIEDLKNSITQLGEKFGDQIRVSSQMEARLTGQNFKITPITPEVQAIASMERTEWRWEVSPTIEGSHQLHLTVTALLSVEGRDRPKAIRTFDKTIDVTGTATQRISKFIQGNWQWLWTVVLVPIFIWLRKKWWANGKGPRDNTN